MDHREARRKLWACKLATGLLGLMVMAFVPVVGHTQADPLLVPLPNPDGRDPIFNQSRRGNPIAIEFLDAATDQQRSLTEFPARVRLINFWATWCVPCIRELPSLSRLAEKYPDETLRVVAISLDRTELDTVFEYLASLDVRPMDWYFDESRQSGLSADVQVLPTTLLVDAEGRELGRIVGSVDWESAEALALLETLIQRRTTEREPTAQ